MKAIATALRRPGRGPSRTDMHSKARIRYLSGVEALEARRVLDCAGVVEIPDCVPGDSDLNGVFDQLDIVRVLQAGKYLTGEPATRQEGDWNEDGAFNQQDIVAVLQAGTYLQLPDDPHDSPVQDLTSLATDLRRNEGTFRGPTVIGNETQLIRLVGNDVAAANISAEVDFATQVLLLFTWQGSGQDTLTPEVVESEGSVAVVFRYDPGLTRDLRNHSSLFAIDADVPWSIERAVDQRQLIQTQIESWLLRIDRGDVPEGVSPEQVDDILASLEDGNLDLYRELTADIPGLERNLPNGGNQDQRVQTQLDRWTILVANDRLPNAVTAELADDIIMALEDGDIARYRELIAEARVNRAGDAGANRPGNGRGRQRVNIDVLLQQWQTTIDDGNLPEGISANQAREVIAALEDEDIPLFRELTADLPNLRA